MLPWVGLIVLGLALLVAGGEVLLRGAVGLATLVRLTPAVIGLTVVAAGTSVPELAVSAIAAVQGKADITVGNVVGSNVFNITLIVGLSAMIRPLVIGGNTARLEFPVLLLVTLLSVALMGDSIVGRLDGAAMLAIYVGFTAYLVSLVRGQLSDAERREYQEEVEGISGSETARPKLWVALALLIAGIALLAAGAQATVKGAVEIARLIGWSERVIGLTIVGAGTGLPEVVTSIVSCIRGRVDVAVGNVIGSNLFNLLVALGLNGVLRPIRVAEGIVHSDNWWMLGATVLLGAVMYAGRRIRRAEGAALLAFYGVYIGLLLR